jgi:hypothetical protein
MDWLLGNETEYRINAEKREIPKRRRSGRGIPAEKIILPPGAKCDQNERQRPPLPHYCEVSTGSK